MSISTTTLAESEPTTHRPERLEAAFSTAREGLLAARDSRGVWTGRLCSSPLATATAISALALAQQHVDDDSHIDGKTDRGWLSGVMVRNELNELFVQSLGWLAGQQNDDGGWGDTDRSKSNIATTMLVEAAFQLTGVPAKYAGILERAKAYIQSQGGVAGLRQRYGKDKTFAATILTNCALAGLVRWNKVPTLPFEAAALPPQWHRRLGLPVVSYAIPALVAIGQAKFHHAPPWNPLTRMVRQAAKRKSLELLEQMQPESGGFLEATPLTSFVVMSLASIGLADHPAARAGMEFLLGSMRSDGSWPVDVNLATRNTAQAVVALDWDFHTAEYPSANEAAADQPSDAAERTLDWLLACQSREEHPYTNVAPGGWSWTDLSGGVPNADDTSAALLALAAWGRRWPETRRDEVRMAALAGINWLLEVQNRDGGMPTFCRGWGKLPFDRSSTDITAYALRGLNAWRSLLKLSQTNPRLAVRIDAAIAQGTTFLEQQQHEDGRWRALWFGNQQQADESNPVYGTAKVLMMYQDLGRLNAEEARRGATYLASIQHASGGWGVADYPKAKRSYKKKAESPDGDFPLCSVEETALAVEALLPFAERHAAIAKSVQQGVEWLCDAVEQGRHTEAAPIGFYFAKLWYYEALYPQIFATEALRRAREMMR